MGVPAGRLRHRVYFKRRGTGDDGYGNEETAFARFFPATSGTVAAEIKPLGGSERIRADRLTGSTVYEVTVRSNSTLVGLTPDDIVVQVLGGVDAEPLNIRAIVNPDMRGGDLVLTCEAGVAQ